jgi:hypothetical protein
MSKFEEPLEKEQWAANEPPTPLYEPPRPRRHRPPSVFWPIMFIGAGVLLLLSNLGYLPPLSWGVLWRLWPLLIIALGIDLLIGQRSVIGAIVSAVLICVLIGAILLIAIFAQNIPAVSDWIQTPELQTQHVEYPLTGLERATVYIDWTSAPSYLSVLEDSPNLIEGDITYRGGLTFDVKLRGDQADVKLDSSFSGFWFWPWGERTEERWDVMLSPDVPLDLSLDAGSGPCAPGLLTWSCRPAAPSIPRLTAALGLSPSSCREMWARGWSSIRAAAPSAPTRDSSWCKASALAMARGRRATTAPPSTPSRWR